MNFGKNLTMIRKQKNISQEELAFIVGISRQTIYTWEADIASPNVVMLKKLSKALDVSIDELVSGPTIDTLPNKMKKYSLEYLSEHDPITVAGLLDWFIKLEIGNEICFGLYDDGIKDYSYHLTVLNEMIIHNKKGYEILVEQYNKDMLKDKCYSLVARHEDDLMEFLAKIDFVNGTKKIQTFKDEEFIKNWGGETKTYFENPKCYMLKYGNKEYKTIQITYFINDDIYIECYLNEDFETLLERRFDKDRPSNETRKFNGKTYGYYYETITDRLK